MDSPELALTRQILQQEERAWRNLRPGDYDRALCKMMDEFGAATTTAEHVEALLALAGASLRRSAPRVVDSRARIAERLLTLSSGPAAATLRPRVYLLFLLAWLRLGVEAAAGPDRISSKPDLPPGAGIPFGADPQSITDPILRQKAHELEARHAEDVERWTASQHAIHHLYHLATLVRAVGRDRGIEGEAFSDLRAAMSAVPGLAPELQKLLEQSPP